MCPQYPEGAAATVSGAELDEHPSAGMVTTSPSSFFASSNSSWPCAVLRVGLPVTVLTIAFGIWWLSW